MLNRFRNIPYVKKYYFVGIFLTGIILFNFIILIYITSSLDTVDRVLGLGKQRVLSQRIAYLTSAIIAERDDEVKLIAVKDELTTDIDVVSQDIMNFANKSLSPSLKRMYFELPFDLDDVFLGYLQAAQVVVVNYHTITVDDPAYVYITTQSITIMNGLDAVTAQYLTEDQKRVNDLSTVKVLLLALSVWLLLFEGVFVFRPMGNMVEAREDSLENEISERMTVEHALRATEETERMIIKHLPNISIMFFDTHMRFIVAEGSFLESFGLNRENVVGKILEETVTPDRYELIHSYYERALLGISDTFEGLTVKGVSYRSSYLPVFDDDRNIVGGMVISENLTNEKNAQRQELELAIQREHVDMLSSFIQDTAHELKTPLSIIKTSAYLISKSKTPEKITDNIAKIDVQVDHLVNIIDQLYNMSNIDSYQSLNLKLTNVNALLEDSINSNIKIMMANGIKIHRHFNEIPNILLDSHYMKEALSEIIKNGIIYNKPTGILSVYSTIEDNHLIIRFIDTGIGIKYEELALIFNRFYKINKARTSNSSGVGLGLTIAKKIIEKHNGTLSVESELDIGSIFTVMLPL